MWGFTVVADSAQFSSIVTELGDQTYVATARRAPARASGFTLTIATIWLIPYLVDEVGWEWAFAFLRPGPALGVVAMLRLRGRSRGGRDRRRPTLGMKSERAVVARIPMRIDSLDHIALWVADRDAIADEAVRGLGMHVIDRTDKFTLIGSDARRGKLTLFAAEGPRERGALKHIGLRVNDLAAASEQLGAEESPLPEGLVVRLVEAATEVEYDLDHVALYSRDPAGAAQEYLDLGFAEASPGPDGAPRVEAAAPTSSSTRATRPTRASRS